MNDSIGRVMIFGYAFVYNEQRDIEFTHSFHLHVASFVTIIDLSHLSCSLYFDVSVLFGIHTKSLDREDELVVWV